MFYSITTWEKLTVRSVRGVSAAAAPAQFPMPSARQPAKPASQQQPAADPATQPPVFRAGINYVRVDAIITDDPAGLIAHLKQ